MLISEIGIKGYKSFGNNEQVLKLDTDGGKLSLLVGNNGNGKSVDIETEIEVDIPIENFNLEEYKLFLEVMGTEREYNLYIKKNNPLLYEQYINEQKTTK